MTFAELNPPYSTIVADPPWPYPGGVSAGGSPSSIKSFELPYQAMSIDEMEAMPVADLASKDSWLFLWTTNRHLPASWRLLKAWGFGYRQMLVWHKPGASPFGGTLVANGAEFLICASRGAPKVRRSEGFSVITSNRVGAGKHSTKPAGFADLVEQVSPGPYVELFARQPRLGWDSWGYGYEGAA